MRFIYILLLILSVPLVNAHERKLNIAVASNFVPTMKKIVADYRDETACEVNILSGSTGKHYLQIIYGAPIDVFFAADELHPKKLLDVGKANEVFTYAIGKLAYYIPRYSGEKIDFAQALELPVARVSIANPKHAPYGMAAQEVLTNYQHRFHNAPRTPLVFGENVSHAFTLAESNAVEAGFVAYSQIKQRASKAETYWLVPQNDYRPIRQDVAVIKDSEQVRHFLHFFRTKAIQERIKADGYDLL